MTHFSDGVRSGRNFAYNGTASLPGAQTSPIFVFDIVPVALAATAVAASQASSGASNLLINGTQATAGVATFAACRAVSIVSASASDTSQTATVYGTDFYGLPQTETITFNGTTTVNGKKSFFTVNRVAISATLAGNASVGTTNIFGLPYRVNSRNYVQTAWNGAQDTGGTFTAADATAATAATGDVRGTYLTSSLADGTKRLTVWIFVKDPDTQTGLYGVTPA
jgi:hypothetical protein